MVELRTIDARLDCPIYLGSVKARLTTENGEVQIRIDLPTWEWLELTGNIDEILAELHRAQSRPELGREQQEPLFERTQLER